MADTKPVLRVGADAHAKIKALATEKGITVAEAAELVLLEGLASMSAIGELDADEAAMVAEYVKHKRVSVPEARKVLIKSGLGRQKTLLRWNESERAARADSPLVAAAKARLAAKGLMQ